MSASTVIVPVLGSGALVLFPAMTCSVHLGKARSRSTIVAATERAQGRVALFASRLSADLERGVDHLHEVGTLADVVRAGPCPTCGQAVANLAGLTRVRIERWRSTEGVREAECRPIADAAVEPQARRIAVEIDAVARRIREHYPRCVHVRDLAQRISEADTLQEIVGATASLLPHLPPHQRQRILELDSVEECLEIMLAELHARLAAVADPDRRH